MSFEEQQLKELGKKLDPKHVKTRKQAGRELSYVESWHVIAEANRIFGFDGWSRQTIYNKEVCRVECKVGKGQYEGDGFKVGYEAKVLIIVGDVTREGTGLGSGISKDLFDAMEGAAKEAESDAMKRALMTFGNPFGLALYDKKQENVGVDDTEVQDLLGKLQSRMMNFKDGEADKFKNWWGVESLEDRNKLQELNIELYKKLVSDMKVQATKYADNNGELKSPSML
jgi:DNA recombination protein Rad52